MCLETIAETPLIKSSVWRRACGSSNPRLLCIHIYIYIYVRVSVAISLQHFCVDTHQLSTQYQLVKPEYSILSNVFIDVHIVCLSTTVMFSFAMSSLTPLTCVVSLFKRLSLHIVFLSLDFCATLTTGIYHLLMETFFV